MRVPITATRARQRVTTAQTAWQAARDDLSSTRQQIQSLETNMEDDPQLRPVLTPRVKALRDRADELSAAVTRREERYARACSVYDATAEGLRVLQREIADAPAGSPLQESLQERLAVARRRRAATRYDYMNSSTWVLRQFKDVEPHLFPSRCQVLSERRAAENGVTWPPPAPETPERGEWDQTLAGIAFARVSAVEGDLWAGTSCSLPQVWDAIYARAAHDGWDPLLAAHWASLPPSVTSTNPVWAMHSAAGRGRSWRIDVDEFVELVRDFGHDATDRRRAAWILLQIVGPVTVVMPDEDGVDGAEEELIYGWVGVRHDGELSAWDAFPHEMFPHGLT